MIHYKRSEILANRQKWIDYLREPERKKFIGRLENKENPEERCCLGHAAFILGAFRTENQNTISYDGSTTSLSWELQDKLGMKSAQGSFGLSPFIYGYIPYFVLSALNDVSDITPQEIGELLQGMIKGGPNTPFVSLEEYEE